MVDGTTGARQIGSASAFQDITFTSSLASSQRSSDKRDIPAYGIAEAAHHVRLPAATLRSWILGRGYQSRAGKKHFPALIIPADPKGPLLSFHNLVEAHVLRALRSNHAISIKAVRQSLRFAQESLKIDRLLLSEELRTSGGELFLEYYGELINLTRSGQLALKDVLDAHLRRVEWRKDGLPGRLYPFVRGETGDAPKLIAIDPTIAFGRPMVARAGVSTQIIAERIDVGEGIDALAEDYGVTAEEIREAILYQRAA